MRRKIASMPCFVSLLRSIYTVKLVTNPEINKKHLSVQTCRLSGGTKTETLVSP